MDKNVKKDSQLSFSEVLSEYRDSYLQIEKENKERSEKFWNSLTKDQQLDVFCAVVSRIYQGEVVDKGSYRYVLYNIFGFEPDSYGRGMDAGYLELHNYIFHSVKGSNENKT